MIGCLLDCHLCTCCRLWHNSSSSGHSAILCTHTQELVMSPTEEPKTSSRLLCGMTRAGLASPMGGWLRVASPWPASHRALLCPACRVGGP